MYTRHFLGMLAGLIVMGIIGLGGLYLVDNYQQKQKGETEPLTITAFMANIKSNLQK